MAKSKAKVKWHLFFRTRCINKFNYIQYPKLTPRFWSQVLTKPTYIVQCNNND